MVEVMTPQGMEEIESNLREMFQNLMPKRTKKTKMRVPEALETLAQEEAATPDRHGGRHASEAIRRVEQSGIVFLDEIDKIAGREGVHGPGRVARGRAARPAADRRGLDRVNTKHGPVRTDHILFIASGAFHIAKPSDLIPEFQGRFPIRVELDALTAGGLRPHPDRAGERAHPPVRRAARDRERHARLPRRRGRRDRAHRGRGERAHREHRRAPPAHRDGAAARRDLVRRARRWAARRSWSTRRWCASGWRRSSRIRTCRGSSCSSARPGDRATRQPGPG